MKPLLLPGQVDRIFRYPRGRSARLARKGLIPHITLPDGEIRFHPNEIDKILGSHDCIEIAEAEVAHAN